MATPNREPIRGLVAALLNQRELVINRGSEHGVTTDMRFAVLNRLGAEIRDPESGNTIGSVEVPKVIVQVVRVQDKLAVARTFRSKTVRTGGGVMGFSNLFAPAIVEEVPETLRSGESRYVEEMTEDESFIKVGDPVVEVVGNEFDAALPDF